MIHIDCKIKNQMAGSAPISMRITYDTSLESKDREGQGGMQVDCCFLSATFCSSFKPPPCRESRGREQEGIIFSFGRKASGEAILFYSVTLSYYFSPSFPIVLRQQLF